MLLLEDVKNIIFDFGGVIINIDFNLNYQAFKELGVKNLDSLFSKAKQTELFDNFEKGIISPDEFRIHAKSLLGLDITDDTFDRAWNTMLLDIPIERIDLLNRLKSKYRIFLLSNSNKIHFDKYNSDLIKTTSLKGFDDLFEKVYFSFNLGMIKPNADIFEYVLTHNNLIASETLFIDDSIQHINTAKELGLQTFHLDNIDIVSLFEKHNKI